MERQVLDINEIPTIKNWHYAYFYNEEDALSKGYEYAGWSNQYVKTTDVKCYSMLCNPKHFSDSKYNDHKYRTCYFYVKAEDFNNLPEKPTLEEVVRPMELTNYDWHCAEVSAKEVKGMGWTEQYGDQFGCHHINHYFLID